MKRRDFIKLTAYAGLHSVGINTFATQNQSTKTASNPKIKKLIFAHYMANYGTRKIIQSIDEWKDDITDAIDIGIDGWQFNFGHFKGAPKENIANFYTALKNLGEKAAHFQFFPSFDCNKNRIPTHEEVVEWFKNYYDKPQHYRINNLPLISLWQSSNIEESHLHQLKIKLKEIDKPVSIIPWISVSPNTQKIEDIFDEYSSIDGFFTWPSTKSSNEINDFNSKAFEACKNKNKTLIAGISFSALSLNKAARYTNRHGAEAITKQMTPFINGSLANCKIINVISWNDFGEDHHITPHPPIKRRANELPVWNHIGYGTVLKYYIEWWKSNMPPEVKVENLVIFHRKQLVKDGDSPYPRILYKPDLPDDSIYITLILKENAELIVYSGNSKPIKFSAPSGISNWECPATYGTQKFVIIRNSKVTLEHSSSETISPPDQSEWSWSLHSESIEF